jgi:radical SAM superfamily enzyme YgiQ (UPF0313 family)
MRILYLPNEYSQQRQRDVKAKIYPILLAMEATKHYNDGDMVYWGYPTARFDKTITEPEGLPFLDLPAPNRILTKYWEYQDNGNFKYLPATYIQSARDCWYHKCNFCAWAKKYPVCETRSVDSVIAEIEECVKLGIREIFDDSGTFPVGDWLKDFCQRMISTRLNKKVVLGCNMRFGALDLEDFDLMKQAGFRMILWGLESVNQDTLDRLSKGIRFEEAVVDLELANRSGLWNHVAVIFGYPWESYEDSRRTYDFIKQGMLTNKIKTAQASIYDVPELKVSPLLFEDSKFRDKVYKIYRDPRYLWNRIKEIRNFDDIEYYLRGFKKLWGRK